MKRTTKTVDEVAGMLHKPGRKAKTDAEMNAAVRRKAKAEDDATKNKPKWGPMADWELLKSWKEIAPGVDIDDDWPGFELVYMRIENAQMHLSVWDGPDGKQTEVIVALPRKVAKCFLPLKPVPNDPVSGLKNLHELFKKQKKTPLPRKKRKPSNDAG